MKPSPTPARRARGARTRAGAAAVALAAAFTAATLWPAGTGGRADADESAARVILNGVPVPVSFNDGDTFRVLRGPQKGARARLTGFNTLESYGPVHQWGEWTHRELYVLAKMGTLNAQRGTWTCESDGNTDGYGRLLAWCPDLAESQIRNGFAHAITVTDDPAPAALLEAQREAIAARRGIWAHGVPEFVLTSLHSIEENQERGVYNRLVSTEDGHSVQWWHRDGYAECQTVCQKIYTVNADKVLELAAAMKGDPEIAPLVEGLSDGDLVSVCGDFAKFRHVNRKVARDNRKALGELLLAWATAGRFGHQIASDASCMVHAPYQRRFGRGKAKCLKVQ